MDRSSILRASTNSYKQVEKCFYLLFYYIQIPRRIELYAGRGRKENAAATQGGMRFPGGNSCSGVGLTAPPPQLQNLCALYPKTG